MSRRAVRRFTNGTFLVLAVLATLIGLACLGAILWTLMSHGLAGMASPVFTQMTPPPGGRAAC